MYVPDRLVRLNVKAELKAKNEHPCDYCNNPATIHFPVYNPVDRINGIDGAYAIYHLCDKHAEKFPYEIDDLFVCDGCGEVFITNHSWNNLVIQDESGRYCHHCYQDRVQSYPLQQIISDLSDSDTSKFYRLSHIVDNSPFFECEYSEFSDFPRISGTQSLAIELQSHARANGIATQDKIIALVTHTYQFSVCLAFYKGYIKG